MKLQFFLLASFLYGASAMTQSERDQQRNLHHPVTPKEVPLRTFASVDAAAVEMEDEQRDIEGLPPRFAIPNHDLITPGTDGIWESTPEGLDLWRLRVEAPKAKSLNFGFTKYNMPAGGQLSIYSVDDEANSIRPFTSADNKSHGELWTPPILTDTAIIEVTIPPSSKEALQLELTSINVGYRAFHKASSKNHRALSGSCNIDVACWQGDDWQTEIASAGVYSLWGTMMCSGGLINRVDNNFQANDDVDAQDSETEKPTSQTNRSAFLFVAGILIVAVVIVAAMFVEYLKLPRIASSLVYSTSYLDLPDSLPLIHPFSSLTTSSQSTTSFQ